MLRSSTNGITGRLTTLNHEISKAISNPPCGFTLPPEEIELRKTLLNFNGICEYCEKNEANTMDHYNPLIIDTMPSQYCNDPWNLIPCCSTCNSSKGSQQFAVWLNGSGKKNPFRTMSQEDFTRISAKFERYEPEYQKYHYKKSCPMTLVSELKNDMSECLERFQKKADKIHELTTFTRSS
jgi:hypothetical protein